MAGLAAFGALVLALALATPAAAASDRSITVTPSSGLQDGQTVSLSGSGFTANTQLFVVECNTSASGAAGCDVSHFTQATSDADGNFSLKSFTVSATFGSTDCTKQDCVIQAAEGASPDAPRGTSGVLEFAAGSTTSSQTTTSAASGSSSATSGSSSSSAAGGSSTSTPATSSGSSTPGSSSMTQSRTSGAVAGAGGTQTTTPSGELAFTGAPAGLLLGIGTGLLLLGGLVVALSRSRRSQHAR